MCYLTKRFFFFTIQGPFPWAHRASLNVYHDNHIGVKNINRPVLLDKPVEKISIVFDWSSGSHVCNTHLSNKTRNRIMARYKILIALEEAKLRGGNCCTPCVEKGNGMLV